MNAGADAGALDVAVFGPSEFTLGFELAGVRTVIPTSGLAGEARLDLLISTLRRDDIGILIVDEDAIQGIQSHDRAALENSIRPVALVLSKEKSDTSSLRRQIIRAIGVDVYRDEA